MLYAESRHAFNLGPGPASSEPDEDWGIQEGFVIMEREKPRASSNQTFDRLLSQATSSDAPKVGELKQALINRCRKRQKEEIESRKACSKRRKVETELRRLAEEG